MRVPFDPREGQESPKEERDPDADQRHRYDVERGAAADRAARSGEPKCELRRQRGVIEARAGLARGGHSHRLHHRRPRRLLRSRQRGVGERGDDQQARHRHCADDPRAGARSPRPFPHVPTVADSRGPSTSPHFAHRSSANSHHEAPASALGKLAQHLNYEVAAPSRWPAVVSIGIAIHGAAGRMGLSLVRVLADDPDTTLVAAVDRADGLHYGSGSVKGGTTSYLRGYVNYSRPETGRSCCLLWKERQETNVCVHHGSRRMASVCCLAESWRGRRARTRARVGAGSTVRSSWIRAGAPGRGGHHPHEGLVRPRYR